MPPEITRVGEEVIVIIQAAEEGGQEKLGTEWCIQLELRYQSNPHQKTIVELMQQDGWMVPIQVSQEKVFQEKFVSTIIMASVNGKSTSL